MADEHDSVGLRLRPHHIFCNRFSPWSVPERGEAFNGLERRIREVLQSGTETLIEVVQGVDELCGTCPLCGNDRCQSADGDEDEVRKWDAIILKGIGVSYGDRRTAGEFSAIIAEKAPLPLCLTRCRYREGCSVSGAKSG